MREVKLKYIWALLAGVILFMGGIAVFAEEKSSTTATLVISAEIRDILDLDATVFRVDADKPAFVDGSNTIEVDEIDFGKLGGKDETGKVWKEGCLDERYGIWFSAYYFVVFLSPDTSGDPYEIYQEFTAGGVDNPLKVSLVMTPGYCREDKWHWWDEEPQGDMLEGDNLGESGCKVTDGCGVSAGCAKLAEGKKRIYESNSGEARIIRGYYGLATGNTDPDKGVVDPEGAKVLTTAFKGGTYTGQIIFTLVEK